MDEVDKLIRVEVQGPLVVWDSEGGFGPDEILISGKSMTDLIADLYAIRPNCRGSLGINGRIGRVRISIERIE